MCCAYYDDADNDPYEGHGGIVADFMGPPVVAPAAGALAPQQERVARVYASAQQPGTPNAFLLSLLCRLANDPTGTGAPKITLFHRLAHQYTAARQGLPVLVEWANDMAFAFKGGVTGPQADIPSVLIWSQDYFHQTNQLRVCTQLVVHDDHALAAADPAIACGS
jgi:hypothetical protein